jgi:hypothetical protein
MRPKLLRMHNHLTVVRLLRALRLHESRPYALLLLFGRVATPTWRQESTRFGTSSLQRLRIRIRVVVR